VQKHAPPGGAFKKETKENLHSEDSGGNQGSKKEPKKVKKREKECDILNLKRTLLGKKNNGWEKKDLGTPNQGQTMEVGQKTIRFFELGAEPQGQELKQGKLYKEEQS